MAEAITLWHSAMALHCDVFTCFLDALQGFALKCNGVCKVGTMFSGSDMVRIVLGCLSQFWHHTYDIDIRFEFMFAAEKELEKQMFLTRHCDASLVFGDCTECSQTMAANVLNGEKTIVPWVHWLWAGFPCVSKSKANNKRAQFKDCVVNATASTGEGFEMVRKYVETAMPDMISLENVPELAVGEAGITDADHIVKKLRDLGYWATYFVFDAADFASVVVRERCYWHAVKHKQDGDGVLTSFMHRMLVAMRQNDAPFTFDRFIIYKDEDRRFLLEQLGAPDVKNANKFKKMADPGYKDEHNELYRRYSLSWPPSAECLDKYRYDFKGCSPRMIEMIYFLDVVFAFGTDAEVFALQQQGTRTFEFIDANQSLARLVQCLPTQDKKLTNPWSRRFPTMTGQSAMAMRSMDKLMDQAVVRIRLLEGIECMALAGWDHPLYNLELNIPPGPVLTRLAGNAFSAFACGPFAMMGIAAAGREDVPKQELSQTISDVDSSQASE